MRLATTPQDIINKWGKEPLNFDPGTKWQYSNTNYVIAGQIVEKVSGKALFAFLQEKVFEPLGMRSVVDVDQGMWDGSDPVGYTRFALGPSRPVSSEGRGWADAAGELAMTAGDLALWDVALINGTLLKRASIKALTTEVLLKNGSGTGYALGLAVDNRDGHRAWRHSGGMAGFISQNSMLPDDRMSITVLTNQDDPAASRIENEVESILTAPAVDPEAVPSLESVRRIFKELQEGKFDRSQFTNDANAYFTTQAIADFATSLRPLGTPLSFMQTHAEDRGGMRYRSFAIRTATKALTLFTFTAGGGKLSQYLIYPAAEPKSN